MADHAPTGQVVVGEGPVRSTVFRDFGLLFASSGTPNVLEAKGVMGDALILRFADVVSDAPNLRFTTRSSAP